jgi:hypothetical protein
MYGIFDGATQTVYNGVTTLKGLGLRRVKDFIAEEGYTLSSDDIGSYLDSWIEWSKECNDEPFTSREDAIETAVSTIVFTNIHFIDFSKREQISSADREIVAKEVYRVLELGL